MNRYLILGHICISLGFVLAIIKLRQHFGFSEVDWIFLGIVVVFYWLGVLSARRKRAK